VAEPVGLFAGRLGGELVESVVGDLAIVVACEDLEEHVERRESGMGLLGVRFSDDEAGVVTSTSADEPFDLQPVDRRQQWRAADLQRRRELEDVDAVPRGEDPLEDDDRRSIAMPSDAVVPTHESEARTELHQHVRVENDRCRLPTMPALPLALEFSRRIIEFFNPYPSIRPIFSPVDRG
jgi:hypothetical protein